MDIKQSSVAYQNYASMLLINKDRLDDELEVHAEVMYRIGEYLAEANELASDAKERLSQIEAEEFSYLKDDGASDAKAAKLVTARPRRVEALSKYRMLRGVAERWSFLYEAWKSRGFSIKTLSDLYAGQYFAPNSSSGRGDNAFGKSMLNRLGNDYESQKDYIRTQRKKMNEGKASSKTSGRRRIVED